jgi:RND family efflux transporter MFP subunit
MRRYAVLAAATLAGTAACMQPAGEDETTDASKSRVLVEPARRADIIEKLTYVADLEPYAEVRLYSPLPDRIISFPWENGQKVKKGQLIALIRKEGVDRGIDQVMAQADALDVQIRHLESELKRSQELLDAGVITRQTFDQVQTSLESTRAQRRALDASRAQMAVTANNAVITAPIDGVIGGKTLQRGDMAAPQIPLCSVMQIERLKGKLRLVEADVAKVRLGHAVVLHFDAYPEEAFEGTVTSILPYLDAGTRTNTVEVTIDNPEVDGVRRLKPRMFGTAELVLERREGVVVAPEPALLLDSRVLEQQGEDELLRKAFVVDADDVAHERLVRLGARNGSLYEIKSGLEAGERLVVRGQHGLREGSKVAVEAEAEASPETADAAAAVTPSGTEEAEALPLPGAANESEASHD